MVISPFLQEHHHMNVLIIKVDYFDPEKWPVLGGPYKVNPEGSRSSITEVAHTATSSGIILLVGSQSPRTKHSLKIKLLGAVQSIWLYLKREKWLLRNLSIPVISLAGMAPFACHTAYPIQRYGIVADR